MKSLALLLSLALPGLAHAADIAPQLLTLAGTTPTYAAASGGGDTFTNDGRTYAHLKNASGSAITVTFDAVPSYSDNALGDLALADTAVVVPANAEKVVGFFPPARFNNTATGKVAVTYSGVTSLTVAVVKVGRVY